MSSTLGERVKSLRIENQLSQAKLASIMGLSKSYVGCLERGSRKGSDQTLIKLAQYFNIPSDELLQLRDEKGNIISFELSKKKRNKEEAIKYPNYIKELVEDLLDFNPWIHQQMVDELNEELQHKLSKLLNSYSLDQVKEKIVAIKNYWLALVNEKNSPMLEWEKVKGIIKEKDKDYYFKLTLREPVVSTLLQEEKSNITTFEALIGEPSVYYEDVENLPYLTTPQKIITYLWFSPRVSTLGQFRYLKEYTPNVDYLTCNDHKLNWFIQQHQYDKKTSAF
ncbi:helix-turn-helix domain-containing protein [Pontibacillus yanchengensis]|nr:helix-turn-helix transcriptional regulator [Pontibacillus yanchengensis]